jgi:hypothetical protein
MTVNGVLAAFASGLIYLFIHFGVFSIPFRSRDSSVGTETGYVLHDRGSIPRRNGPACSFKTLVSAYKITHNLNNYADSNKNKMIWEELIAYFPFTRHGSHRKKKITSDTQHGDIISLLLFLPSNMNRLKTLLRPSARGGQTTACS